MPRPTHSRTGDDFFMRTVLSPMVSASGSRAPTWWTWVVSRPVPARPKWKRPRSYDAWSGSWLAWPAKGYGCPSNTSKPKVAAEAIAAGAAVVNDVAALEAEGMAELCAAAGVGVVLMHMRGNPRTMQDDPTYDDVVGEIHDYLRDRIAAGEAAGVDRRAMAIDPGIGFGKTIAHNLALLNGLPTLAAEGVPVLVGASRKAFLGVLTGRALEERDVVTAVSAGICVLKGASIVRVHDVPKTRDALALADAMVRGDGRGRPD